MILVHANEAFGWVRLSFDADSVFEALFARLTDLLDRPRRVSVRLVIALLAGVYIGIVLSLFTATRLKSD